MFATPGSKIVDTHHRMTSLARRLLSTASTTGWRTLIGLGTAAVRADTDFVRVDTAQSFTTAQADQARANLLSVGRNKIINGGFTINQRVYVSAAALASTVYGHDRWKAGASGGAYSFTQLESPTTITTAASKSLIQVVEANNVEGGAYILSWTGTATARVTVNSATPSGNFAVSPIAVSGQTAGTTMSVEFTGANAAGTSAVATNTGTLGSVQLELGTKATPFDFRPFAHELILCQRYFYRNDNSSGYGLATIGNGYAAAAQVGGVCPYPVQMRATPSMTQTTAFGTLSNCGTPVLWVNSTTHYTIYAAATVAGNVAYYNGVVSHSAEL